MAANSKIEWTNATWNPVRGCSRITTGCGGPNHEGGCYAEKIAARFSDPGQPFHGFAKRTPHGGAWTGKLALVDELLTVPLRWKKPRRIFVNSMSDLFHENLPDEAIDKVFAVMAVAGHHTFQVLTKRAERMQAAVTRIGKSIEILERHARALGYTLKFDGQGLVPWPLPNVWLGVSAERQEEWSERKEHLRNTPAVIHFASFEPLLGPIEESKLADYIQWGIIGGESGPNSRDTWTPNIRALMRRHQQQGVLVFVKQLGANVQDRDDAGFDGCGPTEWPAMDYGRIEHSPNGVLDEGYQGAPVRIRLKNHKGGDWNEWPEDLRVRQFPRAAA